ncbi:putative membrane protein YkvI [Desulfitispora alkaliphila]
MYGKNNSTMETKNSISSYKIATAYIGTIVGAGFASGQEVLQFFGVFGIWGLIGIILITGMFAVFGYGIMKVAKKIKADSHLPVIREVSGAKIGYLIDIVITAFLYGAVVTMAAGMGAIFLEEFNLSQTLGSAVLLGLTLVTVLFGIKGVLSTLSVVVPILMLTVLTISVASIATNWGTLMGNLSWTATEQAPVPFWPMSALIYTSYNIVIAIAVLAPLGLMASDENMKKGAILSGIGLGMGAGIITAAILANVPQVLTVEVPMLLIAGQVSPLLRVFYTVALIAGVYTTAVACLYGFGARVISPESVNFKYLVVGASVIAFFLSGVGFSSLVGILFPAVGYAGLLLLGSLTYTMLKGYQVNFSQYFNLWRLPGVGYRKLLTGNEKEQNKRRRNKN